MQFSVERNIVIDAPAQDVRQHLINFENWPAWSPWSVLEPDHNVVRTGSMGEAGSQMAWDGEVIGSGEIELTAIDGSSDDFVLSYDLRFLKPWKSTAKTQFSVSDSGKGANVTWTMDSSMPFFMFFMIPMIKAMVGMDYDRGLAMLKSVVQTGKVNAETSSPGVVDFAGFSYVGLPRTSHMSDMPTEMEKDFEKLMSDFSKASSMPEHYLTVYPKVKMIKQLFSFISSVSDEHADEVSLDDRYVRGTIKSQKMLEIRHQGSYEYLGNAWTMGHMILRAKKLKTNGKPFEYYHNSPNDTPEGDLLTSIYFPVKG